MPTASLILLPNANLTVGLLETCTGTTSTIFLWLATTRIGHKEVPVVRHKSRSQLVLGTLIHVLGVVSDDALGNGGSDGVDLSSHTSSLHSDADVKVGELVLAEDENGLEGLEAKAFGLDVLNGLSINLDETTALLGESASGGGLFPGLEGNHTNRMLENEYYIKCVR